MGLTFVAAGVSVPDALSSLAVIKEGLGDMAVSNAIGSNVFDILVCLGLPWFIQTAMIQPGSHVNVTSRGIRAKQIIYILIPLSARYIVYKYFLFIRFDIFDRFIAIDSTVFGRGNTFKRMEIRSTIWDGFNGLVLNIYRICGIV